jgi:hypothetical protein
MSSSQRRDDSLDVPRNFSLSTDERVRAIATGPLAYMRRLRSIEDLEESLVRMLVEDPRATAPVREALEKLNDLIARHNRWYPIEANLPMHLRTGELIDRTGRPFRPMAPRTLEELMARAEARARA